MSGNWSVVPGFCRLYSVALKSFRTVIDGTALLADGAPATLA